jgi:hypothetical protein
MSGEKSYSIICFAINMPGSLLTIPIGFKKSLKARSDEYMISYDRLRMFLLEKIKVCLDLINLVSDEGSSEGKFSRLMEELLLYYLCWFHVLNKNLIPKMRSLKDKEKKEHIILLIRKIYSSKTVGKRRENVRNLKRYLRRSVESKYLEDISRYFEIDMLDQWKSLRKFSQYSEHTNNYIEKMFNKVIIFLIFSLLIILI